MKFLPIRLHENKFSAYKTNKYPDLPPDSSIDEEHAVHNGANKR